MSKVTGRDRIRAMSTSVLKLSCPDKVGVLSSVTSLFARNGSNLTEVHQHTDMETGWFFTRIEFDPPGRTSSAEMETEIAALASELGAEWSVRVKSRKYRLAIMCSKEGHCLIDLLWRWRSSTLPFELVGVVSNHGTLRAEVEREGIPFVEIPVGAERDPAFKKVDLQMEEWGAEVVVLARYMQIIPPWLCLRWENRAINIHHSFLPAFPGASPYLQAHRKGVKIIGATCHYVTADLDDGPIIEQEVLRVGHCHRPDDLVRIGQDCERLALCRGLLYHLEDRVFCHRGKTVVFSA